MVGDDDVGLAGRRACPLGEALREERAPLPQALQRGDGHLAPCLVGDAGHEVVTVAGVGLVRPGVQPAHVVGERGGVVGPPAPPGTGRPRRRRVLLGARPLAGARVGREIEERRPLDRVAAGHLVLAQVVVPALEQRDLGRPGQLGAHRLGDQRQVARDDLALQGEGGRGDDDALAVDDRVPHGRDEVRERLTRARARLHQEVPAVVDGLGHRLGHAALPLPPAAAEGPHRQVEELRGVGGVGGGHPSILG